MRSRIGIEYAVQTIDTFGQAIETWQPPIYRWAKVAPISGEESDIKDGVTMRERINIHIRGGTALSTTSRLIYRGNAYQIKSMIDSDQERSMISIVAERLQ